MPEPKDTTPRPKRRSVITEFADMVRQNRSYWMIPIIGIVVLLVGLLTLTTVGGGVFAPFIYAVF